MYNFNNKLCIELNKNNNKPINSWSKKNLDNLKNLKRYQNINNKYFNIGLICNIENDIICLDIDIKNDKNGLEYINNKFNNDFINIMINYTLVEKTPSGGYHIYFTYTNENKYIEDKLKLMTKKINYNGYDILLNHNMVKCYPTINYKLLNDIKINQIPEDLFLFLYYDNINNIINENINNNITDKKELNIINYNINNDEYNIYTDNELISLLNMLDIKYLTDYNKWLIITTILKTENKYNIWDNWCKKNISNYNFENNLNIWNNINTKFNLDYINYICGVKPFKKYKIYKPITNIYNIERLYINNKYLNNMENKNNIFDKYNNIIIKSNTGTGKTTIIGEQVNRLITNNKKLKFLSITSRETLSDQQELSFNDEIKNGYSLNMISYTKYKDISEIDINTILNNNFTFCFNSLPKFLGKLTDDDMSYLIVYLDEITSLLQYITHSTCIKNIKLIFNLFVRLIKNCHKLILTDATINDLSFLLIQKYRNIDDTIFIENEYKNQKDKQVYLINDENKFLNLIQEHIDNKDYFLYGSDKSKLIKDHYNKFNNNKDKFLLFTKDQYTKITKDTFNNSFTFYSPKISMGVDYNNEIPQDVFIYITGKSCDSDTLLQMINRTRNIKNLYIFNLSEQKNKIKYHNIDECKDYFKKYITLDNNFNNMCLDINDDNETKINENLFFELYVYNEFVKSIYELDKYRYLKNYLEESGMIINEDLNNKNILLDKKEYEEMRLNTIEKQYEYFDEFLKGKYENKEYKKRIKILNIDMNDNELVNKYKDYIIDDKIFTNHINTIKLLKSELYNNNKVKEYKEQSYNIKCVDNIDHKIKIYNDIMKKLNINKFDFNYEDDNEFKLDDNDFQLLIKQFKMRVKKPKSLYEFKKIQYKILNDISNNISYTKREQINGDRKNKYYINTDIIIENLQLEKIRNIERYDIEYDYINNNIIKLDNIKNKIEEQQKLFAIDMTNEQLNEQFKI